MPQENEMNYPPTLVKSRTPKRMSVTTVETMTSSTWQSFAMDNEDEWTIDVQQDHSAASGVYLSAVHKLFPYHLVLDRDLQIVAAGEKLFRLMNCSGKEQILGHSVERLFSIRSPEEASWTWEWLGIRNDDEFFRLAPSLSTNANKLLLFKASVVSQDAHQVMINMVPDANTVVDLMNMDLTTQDMPFHGGYRENLELRTKMSEVSRSDHSRRRTTASLAANLAREKELLESLVPKHVAQGLRVGENVAPRQHEEVTMFFSDVVGFTDMCKQLYPWQVCGMLNRLYCVMDYLLDKFGLFKIETIGDAYVCCSGIPERDQDHARKVALFAIAVSHCVKHVLSPVDGKPIQLRIGIHSGSAASGVVGVNNPRYCVFGDTINVTARHESSGEAGRVHMSAVTQRILSSEYKTEFECIPRGLVEMKGKGSLKTYWLEASPNNKLVNENGVAQLEIETDQLLQQTKFESALERETQEKTLRLAGKLGEGQMNENQKKLLGPVLDIIRNELTSKNTSLMTTSTHSAHSESSKASSVDNMKNFEKHFGKEGCACPARTKSLETFPRSVSECLPYEETTLDSFHSSLTADNLVDIISKEVLKAPKVRRRGSRRSKTKLNIPPAQLFSILDDALKEFDENDF